jgi:hypothetical protein
MGMKKNQQFFSLTKDHMEDIFKTSTLCVTTKYNKFVVAK